MKKSVLIICLTCFFSVTSSFCTVFASESSDLRLIEPAMDMDVVVMQGKQSKTVDAELNSTFDFGIIPVLLIGNGVFSASISKTNTTGELVYIYFYGSAIPRSDLSVAVSPVLVKVKSMVSDGWGFGFVVHGILLSPEDPPYEYKVKLDF